MEATRLTIIHIVLNLKRVPLNNVSNFLLTGEFNQVVAEVHSKKFVVPFLFITSKLAKLLNFRPVWRENLILDGFSSGNSPAEYYDVLIQA